MVSDHEGGSSILSGLRPGAEIRRGLGTAEPDRASLPRACRPRRTAISGRSQHARAIGGTQQLLLAQQSGNTDKIQAAAEAMLAAGYKMPYIRSTLQGEQGDQRMFKQLPQTDQMSLLNQASPAEFDRYFPRYAKKETIRQWYREHPPAAAAP